jgi:hypothetical protein
MRGICKYLIYGQPAYLGMVALCFLYTVYKFNCLLGITVHENLKVC